MLLNISIDNPTKLKSTNQNFIFEVVLILCIYFLINFQIKAQCNNYQVYESIGTTIPTVGGTWVATSMTYGTGNSRTGANNLVFDANNDAIRTPLIANPGIFSFWYSRSNNSTSHSFDIQTSTDGVTWTTRGTTTTPTTAYQQYSINIGLLGLTNIYIRILDTRASGTHSRYVDDISWTSTITTENTIIPAIANCSQTISCGTNYSFSDAGTSNDTYNSSSDITITFTPSVLSNKIQLVFSSFNTETFDGMVIYNGPTTLSPIISSGLGVGSSTTNTPAGSFYGTTSPGTITSTDSSGAITIRFRSDVSTNNSGWLASVSCSSPCAAPLSQASAFITGSITSTSIPASFSGTADGYLVIRSTSNTPPSQPINGTTYSAGNIATLGAGLTFIQNSSSTSIAGTGLTGNTQYYYFIYAYNNTSCSGGPIYNSTGPLTGNGITCPAIPNSVTSASITSSGFTLNWAQPTGGSAATITYIVQVTTDSGYTSNISGSPFSISAPTVTLSLSGLSSNTIYYYRILASNGCNSSYVTGNLTTLQTLCVAPSSQATGLVIGTTTSTSIPATFSGTANGYLIIRSNSSTPPSQPVNGVTYSAGNIATLGSGLTFIQNSASTSIAGTGLTGNTQYYYFIYAYNNTSCLGGPIYNTSGPLTGNGITCPAVPNSVSTASITSSGFTLNWAAPTGGSVAAINYTVQVTTDSGYTSNILGSPFSISAPTVTLSLSGLNSGTIYYYRILAGNGCNSSYVTGSLTTLVVAPSNNQCINATTLPCGASNLSGTTIGTSSYTNGTACTLSNFGVWYTFTGDGNQNIISATTTNFDIEMVITSGTCGSLTNISCQDNALSSGSETYTFTATLGVTYYVYIAYYGTSGTNSDTGNFSISRSCTTPFNPCSSIQNISTCGTTTNLTIASGTGVYSTSSCGWTTPGYEQIYTFTPSITGSYFIQQLSSFTYIDYQFKPVSSGCNNTSYNCIDDISGAGTSPNFTLTAGVQYYLLLDPESSTGGNISFILNCPIVVPTNDNCSGAVSLTVNSTTTCTTNTSGTTSGATQSQVGCTGTADDDVWYSFVATNPSHTVTVIPGSITDAVIQVFSGTICGSLTSLDCVDDTISSNEATILTGLNIGTTYYVRVYSYSSSSGQGTFSICVTSNIPCTAGNGNGGSNTNCPNLIAGGLGLNGSDPLPINSCTGSACTDLEATYLQINQTTNYTVQSIPYNPPYQFGCLQNSVSVNVDDVWSPAITLPFNFCFYGTNYNQCLIGSNGTITFDLTNNTPSGYSTWSFANNLPNNTLFLNTIFGVYHDIDPSKGGQVGWELVTFSSGCRALVASWNNIPMFSSTCNSQLYTGMIVLYENTNIIEVYIKEKNVCSTWNGGNAIVGIQNATGTQAVVASGRNALDNDWTVTNEAWRFTPSGTSLASIKWYQGSGTSGPVVGTNNTLNVCPTSNTTYTAEITYALCSGSTLKITDETLVTVGGNKVWNGSVSTDWNNVLNWTPNTAIPNSTDCVIIPDTARDPIISGSTSALAGTLSILANAALTINSNNNITVTDWVNVATNGTFTIENSGSLIQVNNVSNTGNIVYKRDASIRSLDYVYWSSPVANYSINSIASPLSFGAIYKWNTTVANPNGGQGNWQSASGNTMIAGKGYIASGPTSFSATVASTFNGTFTGVPNNGNIIFPIERGNDINTAYHTGTNGSEITNYSDNWNLIGNPYPSAIRASQFLFNNSTKIMGNVKLWTHGTLPSAVASPFYDTFAYNYSPGDYLTYNFTGTSCCPAAGADLFIGAGQGFFVQMIDGTASTDNITFNNGLRSSTYSNNSFYRLSNNSIQSNFNVETLERNRIWLDIIDSNNKSNRTLIGYIENATMGQDSFYDCFTQKMGETQIYSIIDDTKFSIQGRSLPFDVYDEVPIGIDILSSGNYSIAIAAVDGLFNTQNIYLKDNLLNITHNLKANPYQFYSQTGTINDRFKVIYIDNTLGNPEFSTSNNIIVTVKDEILVNSNNLQMESIVVYNVLGQKLDYYQNINTNSFTLSNLRKNNTTLLLKIKLITGETVVKKVIY